MARTGSATHPAKLVGRASAVTPVGAADREATRPRHRLWTPTSSGNPPMLLPQPDPPPPAHSPKPGPLPQQFTATASTPEVRNPSIRGADRQTPRSGLA